LSARQKNASLWLTVIQTKREYCLSTAEMRMALRLRLHLPPVEQSQLRTTKCKCGAALEDDPLHFLSCSKLVGPAGIRRHDLVVRTLASAARDAQIGTVVEQREALVDARRPTRLRPDLRFSLAHHARTITLISDVAITHPASDAKAKAQAARQPLAAAKIHEIEKQKSYREIAQREGAVLQAFVLETLGAFGTQAEAVLDILGKEVADDEQTQWKLDTRIRVSVALQRGNAWMLRAGVLMINDEWDANSFGLHAVLPHRRVVA
jgi:hypothetical protein